jgi:peptidoglycan/LPS O-acetylase OafA/YrhL
MDALCANPESSRHPPAQIDRRGKERFMALDAWRGICALFVAASHFPSPGLIHQSALVQMAFRYVDFFFVLSGFVIAHAYRRSLEQGELRPFIVRRIGRLWPLHAATLGALVVMGLAGAMVGLHVQETVYWALPANLSLTHSWGYLNLVTWNYPSWSISTEMFAYLFFGLLAVVSRGRHLDVACAVVIVIGLAVVGTFAPDGMGSALDFGVERCLVGFMAGVLAARIWEKTTFRPRGELLALVVSFMAVGLLPGSLGALVVPIFVWTVLVFASDRGVVSRLLHKPFPQMLGRISYSIYMNHFPVGLVLFTGLTLFTNATIRIDGHPVLATNWWVSDLLTFLSLVLVIAVSLVTYAFIEVPGRKWFGVRAEPVPAAW